VNRKRAIVSLILFTIVSIAIILFYMSTTIIESIDVYGNYHYTRKEILEMTGLNDTSSVLDVLLNKTVKVEDQAYIEMLKIDKSQLRHVVIQVEEKSIIGYVDYMGKYICIDNEGYIVDYTDDLDENKPKVRGISLTSFTIDEPLDVTEKIVTSIDAIYRNAQAFDVPVQWIDFDYGTGARISLEINSMEVRMGDISRIEEKFEAIKQIIKQLPKDKKGILYVENMDNSIIFKTVED